MNSCIFHYFSLRENANRVGLEAMHAKEGKGKLEPFELRDSSYFEHWVLPLYLGVAPVSGCCGLISLFRNIVSSTYVDLPLGWRDGFALPVLITIGEGIISTEDTCSGVFGASIEGGSRFELKNEFQSQKLTTAAYILLREGAWKHGGNFFIP